MSWSLKDVDRLYGTPDGTCADGPAVLPPGTLVPPDGASRRR